MNSVTTNSTHNPIRVHDGLQTMSDRQKRHVLVQNRPQRRLNHVVRLVVNGRRR